MKIQKDKYICLNNLNMQNQASYIVHMHIMFYIVNFVCQWNKKNLFHKQVF